MNKRITKIRFNYLRKILCIIYYIRIPSRFSHSCIMNVKSLCMSKFRMHFNCSKNLIIKIFKSTINSRTYLGNITKFTLRVTPILCRNCNYPFLRQRHRFTIRYSFNVSCYTQKVCLNIYILSVIPNCKKFERFILFSDCCINFSSRYLNHLFNFHF